MKTQGGETREVRLRPFLTFERRVSGQTRAHPSPGACFGRRIAPLRGPSGWAMQRESSVAAHLKMDPLDRRLWTEIFGLPLHGNCITLVNGDVSRVGDQNMSRKLPPGFQHPVIENAFGHLEAGRLDRREFIRVAALLGASAATAYAFVGLPA